MQNSICSGAVAFFAFFETSFVCICVQTWDSIEFRAAYAIQKRKIMQSWFSFIFIYSIVLSHWIPFVKRNLTTHKMLHWHILFSLRWIPSIIRCASTCPFCIWVKLMWCSLTNDWKARKLQFCLQKYMINFFHVLLFFKCKKMRSSMPDTTT